MTLSTPILLPRSLCVLVLGLFALSCDDSKVEAPDSEVEAPDSEVEALQTFTVAFDIDGGSAIDSLTVTKDERVAKPADPTKEGYTFEGWHSDSATTTAYDFATPVTANINLYPKWQEKLVQIPDANFRAALQALVGDAFKGDLLDRTHSDVLSLKKLEVNEKNIASLEGVEHFTALTVLWCFGNQLTHLDLSRNTALDTLVCLANQLQELDLSKNTSLTYLSCFQNKLSILDLSSNTALTGLECASNSLTQLDLSQNTALTTLHCRENQLTTLDFSKNIALTVLWCFENQLTSLDLSSNTALRELRCYDNQLTGLDLSGSTALRELHCDGNQLTGLDLSNNAALRELRCYDNQLSSLDLRGIKGLDFLTINAGTTTNPLTELYVHEDLQTHSEIKEAKTNRSTAITISTYDDANARVCADFDPTDGAGTCKDTL